MSGINISSLKITSYGPPPVAAPAAASSALASNNGQDEDFFHRVLDVINPLQHLPVVGTIYRMATGEHIGPLEKVAGDALYGGLWGGIGSLADVAFEAVTGKSAEDTVLGWIEGPRDGAPKGVASAAPDAAPTKTAAMPATPVPATADVAALSTALTNKGVDGDIAGRALEAYRRMQQVPARISTQMPVLASAY